MSRSENMSRIRRRDTILELRVRSAVRELGYNYRIDSGSLPGRPDLSNKSQCWAIFVNGCFWHQHTNCRAGRPPKTHLAYWKAKLDRNRARDAKNIRRLRRDGFRVLIVWECACDPDLLRGRLRRFFSRVTAANRSRCNHISN